MDDNGIHEAHEFMNDFWQFIKKYYNPKIGDHWFNAMCDEANESQAGPAARLQFRSCAGSSGIRPTSSTSWRDNWSRRAKPHERTRNRTGSAEVAPVAQRDEHAAGDRKAEGRHTAERNKPHEDGALSGGNQTCKRRTTRR